ncbi:MAG: translocation/assembly module TamB, partial [Tannerella sp.]|nr:translocation/assembly module TamB [Tannerella sp.]
SLFIDTEIKSAKLKDGIVDLENGTYKALVFNTEIEKLNYARDTMEAKSGFDSNHIRLNDLKLSFNSLIYRNTNDFQMILNELSVLDHSGFYLKSMNGNIFSDSANVSIPSLQVTTQNSEVKLQVLAPWDIINNKESINSLSVTMNGNIGKQDLLFFITDTLKEFRQLYPNENLNINVVVNGNLESLIINDFDIGMPSCFNANLKGKVGNVLKDSIRTGNLELNIFMQHLNFLTSIMPSDMRRRFQIPDSMYLNGNVKMNGGLYSTDMNFGEQSGKVRLSGEYNIFGKSYDLSVVIDSLCPVHFMPEDSLMFLNGSLYATGKGFDVFNKQTWAEIKANITDVHYANYYLTDLSLTGSLSDNALKAEFASDYPLAKGNVVFDGTVKKNEVQGKLTARVDTLDLKGLNFSDSTFATSFGITSDFETNLKRKHALDLTLDNWNLTIEQQQIHPDRMTLVFRSEEDTVKADFNTGDFDISITGNADPVTLADRFMKLSKKAMNQLQKDSMIDMQALRADFPDLSIRINAETHNLLYDLLREYNIYYDSFAIDATISPEEGLNVDGILLTLVKDTLKIDTVQINIWQNTLGLRYNADVIKNRFRNQNPFKASVKGYLYNREADIFVSFVNRYGEKGMDLGVNMKKAPGGFDFHLYPQKVALAFIPFTLNENNFFKFINIKEMEADLYLKGEDDASFWIHSEAVDDSSAMNEMMVELNQINIEKTVSGLSDFQSFKGLLNATLRYRPTNDSYMLVADANVDNLYYDNGRIGEMLLNATYIPVDNNKYQMDIHAFHDMNEIAVLSLMYAQGRNENLLDGIFTIDKLPLKIAEPFVPDNMLEMNGFLHGNFDIVGTSAQPVVSGALKPESMSVFVKPSSTRLSIENKEITMTKNVIGINNFKVLSRNTPFVINGNINAVNMNRPVVNINISGANVPLMDAKNVPGCMAYGKLFVNMNTTVTGPLQSLRTRGNLNILGKTDITYVMPGATLEAQDGFNNIVKFTYFADTLQRQIRRPGSIGGRPRNAATVSGNDVFFTIHIDPVVWFSIDMDAEKKNYVELKGGGDLTFQYSPQGDMLLNGRYSLSEGNIRYNIPVIPLTDFVVRNGSYVDWSGDPLNPYLNITAYSRIRSMVKFDGKNRLVDFNAGIRINNNLDKMALEFILEAPNDMNVQNQLASMGEEERSKQAISMLVTGIYLASSGTGTDDFDVNAALSSFLQRELKNMIGKFLGEAPVSFEVLTYDGLFGVSRRIDYMGRLNLDLFNDHINTTVGVRYTTNDPLNGNQLLLDDVSLEYRPDADGSRAVSLFRNKEYKNIFEGEIGRTGAGFTIRKKVKTLKEMFIKEKSVGGKDE